MDPQGSLAVGSLFSDKKELQKAVRLLQDRQGRHVVTGHTNTERVEYFCATNGDAARSLHRTLEMPTTCPVIIKARIVSAADAAKGDCQWKVTASVLQHTCSAEQAVASKRNRLALSLADVAEGCLDVACLNTARGTQGAHIRTHASTMGVVLSAATGFKVRGIAREMRLGNHKSMGLLRPSLLALKAADHDCNVNVTTTFVGGQEHLLRCFLAWGFARRAFETLKPFVSLDACHTMPGHGVLLSAIGSDANGDLFPLAIAYAESESTVSWTYFLQHLLRSYPLITTSVLCTDADKGTLSAIRDVFGDASHHVYCMKHRMRNMFAAGFNEASVRLFVSAASAPDREQCDKHLAALAVADSKAYEYVTERPLEEWATSYIPLRTFGKRTSNDVESWHNFLLPSRRVPVETMFLHITEAIHALWLSKRCDLYSTMDTQVQVWRLIR